MADEASVEDQKISSEMEEKVPMDPEDNEETEEEEMDADEDEESSTDDSDEDELEKEKIRCLEEQIRSYPFNYQPHVELVELLRQAGELNRLRTARERMNDIFPLTEELWMEWLKDEISLATESDRPKIMKLFERAIADYLSVDIWLEYAQYTIGGMGESDGINLVRSVFDRAVSEVGLHVTKGSNIWDAYREFENAILAGLKPESSEGTDSTYLEQKERLLSLFKRQLSVPLLDMKETYNEFKVWFPDEGSDKAIQQLYQQTLSKLEKLRPLEKELDSADEYMAKMEAYYKYIEYEISQDDPSRIRSIYERAITFGCLDAELWLQYTRYLDTKLPIKKVVLSTYERSVRNCPWKAELWGRYILALERYKEADDKVTEIYDRAINSGFTEPADFLHVYTVFCDYKRRRINWDEPHTEELASFRATIQRAIHSLKTFFGDYRGDPSTLQQYWASIEVKHCKNIEKARELWNSVMTQGHGAEGHMWMEYFQMEKAYGNIKNCRKVLQRALNSVTDWPQMIVDAYLRFEREEGTLEDYEMALNKCTAQLQRLQQRKALAEEKAQMQKDQRRQLEKNSKKTLVRSHTTGENLPVQKETSVAIKRKMDDKQVNVRDKDGFRIPVVPALVGDSSGRHHETDGPTSAKKARIDGPPPGFTATPKTEKGKNENTVFVSNLNYDLEEDSLETIFSKCGEISEIRLIQNFKGKSKGYAYVEFKNFDSVKKSLALDRQLVQGRPMFVSECEDRNVSRTHQFKFATSMEQNKLFIKGLPFTCSKEALETIFKEYGSLKDVRLVTYRNGAPKGLAYVEYEDSVGAAKAVLQTDGLKIGDHTISVSISNPPNRKAPINQRFQDNFSLTPTLGSGKKETELRGKARTMVSWVPRALQRGKSSAPNSSNGSSLHSSKNGQKMDSLSSASSSSLSSSSSSSATQRMSNDDFRQLLLKP